jgi:phosphate transport system ATP-binding protein
MSTYEPHDWTQTRDQRTDRHEGNGSADQTTEIEPVGWSPRVEAPTDQLRRVHVETNGNGATASTLEAQGVSAWFGRNKVLESVTLRMKANHVTALIGPSGCGKSTFLRILNRMHELVPSAQLSGQVLLDDVDIYAPTARATETRKNIGMVFQKPNPFPAMSIYDNVVSGLKLAGMTVSDKDTLVEHTLQRAGLWNEVRNRLHDAGGALSGGQQQRLCIARALAVKPKVLLMDEPCSALDPTSTRRIEDTIAEISHEVTIVIVTHNMQQAQRVSHECAFFLVAENEPGNIVEAGPTEKIFSEPDDERTFDYVNGRFG